MKDTNLILRLTTEEKQQLQALAKEQRKSMTQFVLDSCIYNSDNTRTNVYTKPKNVTTKKETVYTNVTTIEPQRSTGFDLQAAVKRNNDKLKAKKKP